MALFQKHPFPVSATLAHSIVLGFAAPVASLRPLLPEPLKLDTFGAEWGFIAVAMVKTTGLRPAALPVFFGRSFHLIGYRIFCRFTDATGRMRRGLYILRSDTDRALMRTLGDLFTTYRYRHVDIDWDVRPDGSTHIASTASQIQVAVAAGDDSQPLPDGSPFTTWKEARRFAGPMPYTFSRPSKDTRTMLVVHGKRTGWKPIPLRVTAADVGIFDELGVAGVRLANAFEIRDIPYRWERGVQTPW